MTRRHVRMGTCVAAAIVFCFQNGSLLAASPKAPAAPPLDPKFAAFAQAVEDGIAQGDSGPLDSALDWDAFMLRILPEKHFNAETRSQAKLGMKKTFKLGREIARNVEGGGSLKLLRIYREQNQPHALFRFLMEAGGVNYYDLPLSLTPKGEVRYDDIYTYVAGEDISATMRRLMIPILAQGQKTILEKLLTGENEYVQNLDRISAMSRAIKTGEPAKALKIFDELPPVLRRNKTILLVRIQAASAVDTDSPEYQQAMDDFARLFPNDPSTYLILMDSHMNRKQYDKMIASIDALDKKVGGDPYLEVLRATGLMLQKKYAEARATAEKAIQREPTLTVAYWNLITIAMDEKNWGEVSKGLTRIEKDAGIELKDLTTIPDYADFVKSAEYRKWMASRPAKKPASRSTGSALKN